MPLFIGGPYDGMRIGMEAIDAHCGIVPFPGSPPQQFVIMPPRKTWEAALAGTVAGRKASGTYSPYERRLVPGGVEYHADTDGTFARASRGEPEPAHAAAAGTPVPAVPFAQRVAQGIGDRLARFLAGASAHAVPTGMGWDGVSTGQTVEGPFHAFDQEKGAITVSATVRIVVCRADRGERPEEA